jgi:hypothetical protein
MVPSVLLVIAYYVQLDTLSLQTGLGKVSLFCFCIISPAMIQG